MPKSPEVFLAHIRDEAHYLLDATEDLEYADFETGETLKRATVRSLRSSAKQRRNFRTHYVTSTLKFRGERWPA